MGERLAVGKKYRLKLGEQDAQAEVEETADGARVGIDGAWHEVSIEQIGNSAQYSLILDSRSYCLFAEQTPHGYHLVVNGRSYGVTTQRTSARGAAHGDIPITPTAEGEWVLSSPMAGVVQKILVSLNDVVEAGNVLMVIEGMKMQNELRARHGGQVKAIYVSVGQQVEKGTPLLVLL
jgi:biotin carboxyl carrier protein